MKKIYYVFIIVLLVLLLTSTATFCSECRDAITAPESTSSQDTSISQESMNEPATEDSDSNATETEDSQDSDSSATTDDKNTGTQQTTTDSADSDDDKTTGTTAAQQAPAITLEISEGPLYSSADDVCYYRIKAVVTGIPEPVVTFSRDDSNGAWGKDIAQVNFTQQGQTYTLIATAENTAGSASGSMDLNWGCTQGGTQTTDPDDDDGFLFDSDLIIIKKPIFKLPDNEAPVLNQSIQEPSGTLKVGQVFQIRCEGYDPDGDTFEALMAYSAQSLEFIEKISPTIYKWKALKAGSPTIDTMLKDEHGEYSDDILLTLNIVN